MRDNLPVPDSISQQFHEQISARIRHRIEKQGPISFAEYMQMALYEPGLGYYSAGAVKFGIDGDFITAPEISPLFSQCIARQCQQVLENIPNGSILELGAGRGVMAAEVLLALEALGSLPQHYLILEVSADLRERQQQYIRATVPHLVDRVSWLERLPSQAFDGVILGNEVLDAMPVHKFKIDNGIKACCVAYADQQFTWSLQTTISAVLIAAIEALDIDFKAGYESEINLWLSGWVKSLSEILERGVMIFIDYGFPRHEYYHPQRDTGTIACHYRHRSHFDPLILTGIQDITAHVDFTALATHAQENKLEVLGYTHQAGFLINLGIGNFITDRRDDISHYNLAQQIKRLTLPSEMGELFKVIALGKNFSKSLLGFKAMNQVGRLLS